MPVGLVGDAAARVEHENVLEAARVGRDVAQHGAVRVFVGNARCLGGDGPPSVASASLSCSSTLITTSKGMARRELREGRELALAGEDRFAAQRQDEGDHQAAVTMT